MRPLTISDVRPPDAYEPVRAEERRRLVELKRPRRVPLGDLACLVFENRDTVRCAVEEMLRAERIDDPGRIAAELESFNALIPGDGELVATLFLEIADPAEMAMRRAELAGLASAVSLRIEGEEVPRVVEPDAPAGAPAADPPPSVHHLRFRPSQAQRDAVMAGADVEVAVEHPACAVRVPLGGDQRAALAADLRRN